jgi:hypothetical protein
VRQIAGLGRDAAVLKKIWGGLWSLVTIWDFVWRALIVLAVVTAGSILGLILWEVLFGIGNWPRTLSG